MRGVPRPTLVTIHPRNDAVVRDVERVLTAQRPAAAVRHPLNPETALTLEVWDDKPAAAGEALADPRTRLVDAWNPCGACLRRAGRRRAGRGAEDVHGQPQLCGTVA